MHNKNYEDEYMRYIDDYYNPLLADRQIDR